MRLCRYGDAETSEPAVMIGVQMKSGANIIDVCNRSKARVQEMLGVEQSLPPDIAIVPVSDQSENVQKKISDVVTNVIGAVLIVVVIVYLVVGFRTAAVMAANIPVVVLASVALITLFGVELEQISLASIIIALGLLVDNAVQVCDQSRTNQIAGMKPVPATIAGAQTLSMPMLSGTATTVAAFFPMLFALIGSKQEYIYSLPVTLSVTLGISWVLAMTFCVILAAAFIRAPSDPSKPDAPLPRLMSLFRRRKTGDVASDSDSSLIDRTFGMLAGGAIKAKWLTVGVAFMLLIGALLLPVGSEFFPKDLRDQFAIQVWLPETATLEETNRAAREVERILQALSPTTDAEGEPAQQIRAMRTIVGGGGFRWYLSWDPEQSKAELCRNPGPHDRSPLHARSCQTCAGDRDQWR